MVEPWLRGPIENVPAVLNPVLFSLVHAREDLESHTRGLTPRQIWATPHGLASAGFHLRHIGRSVDRLVTYLEGRQLSESQMGWLRSEHEPGAAREELLAEMEAYFQRAEDVIRRVDPATLADPREVGRKKLPTTVAGLLTHIAEHTQRHVGQAISAAKLARASIEA